MNRVAEPYLKVADVVNGFAASRILHVAVKLDVFSKLADEGKTAAQLSTLLGVDTHALELLLNALTAMGFLRKESERFEDTPVSHTYLSKRGPKYLGHLIRHWSRRWDDWGKLEESLRTGKPVRKPDMYQNDPKELEDFIRGMHQLAIARGDARYMSRAIPLRRCRKLLDVGGGPGTYAAMFCRANRNLQATVMDLPATLRVTRKILREFDMTGRVGTMSGDYRSDKIKGAPYDVALLSNILHAEDEETNRKLLRNVHDALVPGGILIVKDHVLSADHTEPRNGAVFALHMFLGTYGRTYSFVEISSWMQAAGFQDMVEVPVEEPVNVSLVLALRPGKRALAVLPKPAAKVVRPAPEEAAAADAALSETKTAGTATRPAPAPPAGARTTRKSASKKPSPSRAKTPASKKAPSSSTASRRRSTGSAGKSGTRAASRNTASRKTVPPTKSSSPNHPRATR
ncbi:MAG: methyltransferase [Candidatus Krumholzibacteriia bacterium]